jgi:hypothetical protein
MSTGSLDGRVAVMINSIDPEFRISIINALKASDGTVLSFQEELNAQVWDMPELPVQDIMEKIAFDVL